MSTDVSSESLSAELEKAAALLKSKGLDHAAAQLLAPEEKTEPKVEEKKTEEKKADASKKKKGRAAAKALAESAKEKKAAKAKAKVKASSPKKSAPKKEAKEKRKAISGQSGPAIEELPWNALNKKEKLLVGCFNLEGEREVKTIEQMADEVFKGKAKNAKQSNSWTRNSLRRLMRSGKWLEKVEPGKYRLTASARKMLSAKDD